MKTDDITKFGKFGLAALLPGMQYMLDLMQKELDQYRQALQETEEKPKSTRKPVVQLVNGKENDKLTGPRSYWYKMTAEQRSAEMARRMKVRDKNLAKRAAKNDETVKQNVPRSKNLRGTEA